MKKIIIAFLIIISGVTFFSCKKTLDLPSDGRLEMKDIFSHFARTEGYFNTCNFIPQIGFMYEDNTSGSPSPLASFCDEAQDANDHKDGPVSKWYSGNTSASYNPLTNFNLDPWGHYFQGIWKCNSFLKNIQDPEIATYPFNVDQKNGWIAQVYVLRAFYYLQLIKRYGGVPIMETTNELNHDYSKDKRATFEECVDFIIESCDKALAVKETEKEVYGFRWELSVEADRSKVTRAFAYAIKSQAALYAASPLWNNNGTSKYTWAKATEITKEALDQCLAHNYELYKTAPNPDDAQNAYAYYFITRSDIPRSWDKETIYESTSRRTYVWRDAGLPITEGMKKAGAGPSQELVDAYETIDGEPILDPVKPYNDDNHLQPNYNMANRTYDKEKPYEKRDPRFYASVYYNGAVRNLNAPNGLKVETFVGGNCGISSSVTEARFTRTGYYLRKFNNWRSDANNSEADGLMRIFRLAELYLNFAEAAYQSVGPDTKVPSTVAGQQAMSAKEAVDAIRERVGMPKLPSGLSKSVFEARYRNERRVELAFEEHRFFDVRRWKILNQTDKFVTAMKITKQPNGDMVYNRVKLDQRATSADKYLMYPIKQSEVAKMFTATGTNWQNPNW